MQEAEMKRLFEQACKLLENKKNLIVAGHVSPDGDAVGSVLALTHALRTEGYTVQPILQDKIPASLAFLPGVTDICQPDAFTGEPDAIIFVDCASLARAGSNWFLPWLYQVPILIFDHHKIHEDFGVPTAVVIIDPDAAAAAQIIYNFLRYRGREINKDTATCLYAGIVSDTGGFAFTNTSSETFKLAGDLLDFGIDLEEINNNIFKSRSYKNMKMLGVVFANLQKSSNGLLVWSFIDLAAVEAHGASHNDCDNLSNQLMLLEGAGVGVLFEERPNDKVRVSLRCQKGFDVGKVAAVFGGGGHAKAAGCCVSGGLHQVMADVLAVVEPMIKESTK